MSRPVSENADPIAGLPRPLRDLRFAVEARLSSGCMSVGDLMALRPGSVVRSDGVPGGRILICSGPAVLASATPLIEDGELSLRIEEVGDDDDRT